MEAWFISDIHLKTAEERNGQILLRFLRSLLQGNPQQIHLFLLGDIFDLWIGGGSHFAKKFAPLMRALEDLKKAGVRITYIEGNHDVYIESYFQKKLGIEVFIDPQYYMIDGLRVRVEHGDLINPNDLKYLKYRAIIRHPALKPLANLVPARLWDYVGDRASRRSRGRSGHYRARNEEQLVTMIHTHSEKAYLEKPFDMIISGHMHVFADRVMPVNGHEIRSINLGSWFEERIKILRIKDGQAEWVYIS